MADTVSHESIEQAVIRRATVVPFPAGAPGSVTATTQQLTPLTAQAYEALIVPLIQLSLLEQRRLHQQRTRTGITSLLLDWGRVAAELMQNLTEGYGTKQGVVHAQKLAERATRTAQGYELAAQDRFFQALRAFLEQRLEREFTEEEAVALCNGCVEAFAAYKSYLVNTAGAQVPSRYQGGVQ